MSAKPKRKKDVKKLKRKLHDDRLRAAALAARVPTEGAQQEQEQERERVFRARGLKAKSKTNEPAASSSASTTTTFAASRPRLNRRNSVMLKGDSFDFSEVQRQLAGVAASSETKTTTQTKSFDGPPPGQENAGTKPNLEEVARMMSTTKRRNEEKTSFWGKSRLQAKKKERKKEEERKEHQRQKLEYARKAAEKRALKEQRKRDKRKKHEKSRSKGSSSGSLLPQSLGQFSLEDMTKIARRNTSHGTPILRVGLPTMMYSLRYKPEMTLAEVTSKMQRSNPTLTESGYKPYDANNNLLQPEMKLCEIENLMETQLIKYCLPGNISKGNPQKRPVFQTVATAPMRPSSDSPRMHKRTGSISVIGRARPRSASKVDPRKRVSAESDSPNPDDTNAVLSSLEHLSPEVPARNTHDGVTSPRDTSSYRRSITVPVNMTPPGQGQYRTPPARPPPRASPPSYGKRIHYGAFETEIVTFLREKGLSYPPPQISHACQCLRDVGVERVADLSQLSELKWQTLSMSGRIPSVLHFQLTSLFHAQQQATTTDKDQPAEPSSLGDPKLKFPSFSPRIPLKRPAPPTRPPPISPTRDRSRSSFSRSLTAPNGHVADSPPRRPQIMETIHGTSHLLAPPTVAGLSSSGPVGKVTMSPSAPIATSSRKGGRFSETSDDSPARLSVESDNGSDGAASSQSLGHQLGFGDLAMDTLSLPGFNGEGGKGSLRKTKRKASKNRRTVSRRSSRKSSRSGTGRPRKTSEEALKELLGGSPKGEAEESDGGEESVQETSSETVPSPEHTSLRGLASGLDISNLSFGAPEFEEGSTSSSDSDSSSEDTASSSGMDDALSASKSSLAASLGFDLSELLANDDDSDTSEDDSSSVSSSEVESEGDDISNPKYSQLNRKYEERMIKQLAESLETGDDLDIALPPNSHTTNDKKKTSKAKRSPAMTDILPGAEVKLKGRLGKGATAIVWSGEVDGNIVAVKQIQLSKYKEGLVHAQKVVQREYNIVRSIAHENVVKYYGMFYNKADAEVNLVMELVEGVNITDLVLYAGKLNELQTCVIVKSICEGLSHLHSLGVIHRDLKPDNIILESGGRIKLIDFGTAVQNEVVDEAAKRRSTVGTPWYCAPEVINGEEYTYSVDTWSLGCCIIEFVSGKPPFDDLNDIQCLYKMAEGNPPPFPKASAGLSDFLHHSLATKKEARPPIDRLLTHPFLAKLTPASQSRANDQLLRYMDEMDKVKTNLLQKTMRIMKTNKGRGNVAIGEWR